MKILQSRPDTAKINGEPVKGNLLKIKKSVIRVDKFLKKDLTKSQRESEKLRRSIEKSSRLKKEKRVETKDNDTKKAFVGKVRVPSLGIFGSLKKFIGTVVLGFFAIKLLPLLPKLIPLAVGLGKFVNFIIGIGGRFLNGFISLVDFGVRAGDATIGFIKNIGGEKTAEVFSKFGGALSGLLDAAILIGTLSLFESGQDYMFDQKNRKPKGPKGRGPLKGVKRSLRRTSLRTIGKTGTKTLGKFGKAGPLAAIFTAFDFMGRKSEGQSNLQAGLGSGSSLAGYAAGAKIGASIGTVGGPPGILIGGLVGGVIGSFIGSSISDKVTGADKVQGRNEGGLVKRKEQDRFKSKEQTLKVGGSISPIEFDSNAKQIFPNDIGNLPSSGDYIDKSFKDVIKTPFIGPLMGLSYKMITGQAMSKSEFEVASSNLKAAAKFGFSSRMLEKSFTDASGKVAGDRSSAISSMMKGEKAKDFPPFLKFLRNNIAPIFGINTTSDPNGKRTTVLESELNTLRNVAQISLSILAGIAVALTLVVAAGVASFFSPAIATVLSKILTSAGKIFGLKGLPRGFAKATVTKKGVGKFAKPEMVKTRVSVENAMDPLRMRRPGEDVVGDILRRSGNVTTNTTGLSRAEQVKARFDRLIDLRKAKSDLVGTGRRGTQNIRRGRIGKDFRIEKPSGKPDGKSLTENLIESIDVIKKPLDQGGITSPRQLSLSRKVLDPKRFSREAAKASKRQRLTRDNVNKSLRESNVGDDLLKSVEGDPKVLGARSLVERETQSIIRKAGDVQPPPGSTLTRSEISQVAESSNVLEKIIQILKTKGSIDPNAATNVNPVPKTFQKGGLTGSQVTENLTLPKGFNLGGFVRGAGGTDMIPARLTSGEFVIDKDSTDYLRATMPGFLAGINKAKYDDVLPVLQSYASYESGFGGQDIVVVAPTTEINNVSGQQMASAPMITAGGSGEDPFEILAKG